MIVKCRECDICRKRMDKKDFQYHIRYKVRGGRPFEGMFHCDICHNCFEDLGILIRRRKREHKTGIDCD